MDTKKLRQKILDLAIHGRLVPQDPNDEPASVLLQRIREEKERLVKEGKIKQPKKAKAASDTTTYGNELPKGWTWATLGEIGEWQSGATPDRHCKDYYGGNIPWLKTGDLTDGLITYIPESITKKALSETSVKLNPKDSVLIAMYGATIGKVGILTFPATTNQACCACSKYGIEKMYLFYFLLANRDNFVAMGGGGAQPNISKEKIVSTPIPLPPISEQNRIVNEIERWFALIDKIEQGKADLQAAVKQTKSKILDLAIHGKLVPQCADDEPATELLRRINPAAACEKGTFGKLPQGWEMCNYKDIFNDISSKPYQILQSEIKQTGKTPVVSQSTNFIEGYSNETCIFRHSAPCIVFGDHTRNIKYIDFDFIVGADGVKIICPKVYERWGYFLLLYATLHIQNKGYSRHFGQITKLKFPLPPLAEQHRIVAKIEELFAQLDSIQSSLEA